MNSHNISPFSVLGHGGLLMGIPGLLMWATGFQKQTHCLELRRKIFALGRPGVSMSWDSVSSCYGIALCFSWPLLTMTLWNTPRTNHSLQKEWPRVSGNTKLTWDITELRSCWVRQSGMVVPFTQARYNQAQSLTGLSFPWCKPSQSVLSFFFTSISQ